MQIFFSAKTPRRSRNENTNERDMNEMKRDIFIYSVDWLQYYCHQDSNPKLDQEFHGLQANAQGYVSTYKIAQAKEFSPIYTEHYCVVLRDRPMLHIHYAPRMSALNTRSASVKVENSLLYSPDWCFYLHDILAALRWSIQNITRVDICCDFNTFHHGRDPERFAADYLRTATKKHPSYLRVGKDKWYAVGAKYVSENKVDYLRWGTRESEVCTYLYNKSKELREKHNKPWIAREWKAAGLDVTKVWRVEFSINSKGVNLFDLQESLYKPLFATDLDTQEAIESIFQVYAAKFFHFKVCAAGDKRKKANLPDIDLFPPQGEPRLKHRSVCREVSSGKTEKVLMNKLQALLDSDYFLRSDEFDCIGKTLDILTQIYSVKQETLGYKHAIANDLICTMEELNAGKPQRQIKPYDFGEIQRDESKFRNWYRWLISNSDSQNRTREEKRKLMFALLMEDNTKKNVATIIAQLLAYMECADFPFR